MSDPPPARPPPRSPPPSAPSPRAAARVLEACAAGTEPRVPGGSDPGSWVPHAVGAFLPQGRKPQAPLRPGRPDAPCAGGGTAGAALSPGAAASRAPPRAPAESSGPRFPAAPGPRSPGRAGAVGGLFSQPVAARARQAAGAGAPDLDREEAGLTSVLCPRSSRLANLTHFPCPFPRNWGQAAQRGVVGTLFTLDR